MNLRSSRSLRAFGCPALLCSLVTLSGCGTSDAGPRPTEELVAGKSDFQSAPPNGAGEGRGVALGGEDSAGTGGGAAVPSASGGGTKTAERKVEETDLYRLDGDRLYYLNAYRGLMVFDISDIDQPKLIGRSPIYGSPVEMIVRDGIASVVVADWYGKLESGEPFHGSIVRGLDARDPSNIKVVGEAHLGGWVRDTRVVGDVLYAVTEKNSWDFGYGGAYLGAGASVGVSNEMKVSVSSVNFAGGQIEAVDSYDVPGSGGVFHVTASAILLASDLRNEATPYNAASESELRYLDISDPTGEIVVRGAATVKGSIQSWGADRGRWNLDFADGKFAHAVGQSYSGSNNLSISTVDFTDPSAPKVTASVTSPMPGWSATARFDSGRLYLSPSNWGCSYDGNASTSIKTPLEVYDVSNPAAPTRLGSTSLDGQIWLMIPNGDRLFVLGNDYDCTNGYQSPIALGYFDMSDPTKPRSLGSANFGEGWAWTPAAGTFKAFTKNDSKGLVVLPFSGWSYADYGYNNGLQLIEFTPETIATSGTAKTKGWAERGIFAKNRLLSLSDLALSVVDYTNPAKPQVVNELTLARNVINARPVGANIVEVSSDFWDNDTDHSELRVLPAAEAEENVSGTALASLELDGVNPTVFDNGTMTYVVSSVRHEVECESQVQGGTPAPSDGKEAPTCYNWTQQVEAVDVSGGGAVKRGKIALPDIGSSYYGWGWGWGGCGVRDWYYGSDVLQVGGNKLAFRRYVPQYNAQGEYVDARQSLYIVDLSDPDAPSIGSTVITKAEQGWWGNLRSVGNQLYASHYEWTEQPRYDGVNSYPGVVRYYIDSIDLSEPSEPSVASSINVPGFLVGASEDDPSVIYTMDYHWDGAQTTNDLAVLKLSGGKAYLQGHLTLPGYTSNVFVKGSTAFFSVESYEQTASGTTSNIKLYQVDLSNPKQPVVLPSEQRDGWGYLLGVEGDRAFMTSGWGESGIDVFRIGEGKAPTFDRFVRTRGWWSSSLARKGDTAYVASGYWGTQIVPLD